MSIDNCANLTFALCFRMNFEEKGIENRHEWRRERKVKIEMNEAWALLSNVLSNMPSNLHYNYTISGQTDLTALLPVT